MEAEIYLRSNQNLLSAPHPFLGASKYSTYLEVQA